MLDLAFVIFRLPPLARVSVCDMKRTGHDFKQDNRDLHGSVGADGSQRCVSAWGPNADWHRKYLI